MLILDQVVKTLNRDIGPLKMAVKMVKSTFATLLNTFGDQMALLNDFTSPECASQSKTDLCV